MANDTLGGRGTVVWQGENEKLGEFRFKNGRGNVQAEVEGLAVLHHRDLQGATRNANWMCRRSNRHWLGNFNKGQGVMETKKKEGIGGGEAFPYSPSDQQGTRGGGKEVTVKRRKSDVLLKVTPRKGKKGGVRGR